MGATGANREVEHAAEGRVHVLTDRVVSALAGMAPPGFGQSKVAHALAPRVTPRVVRCTLRNSARFALDLEDRMQAEAYLARRYAVAVCREITRHMPPDGVFFDAGANVGLITFTIARRCGARVHAFEPNPAAANQWDENQRLNPSATATLTRAAVGAAAGTVTFAVRDELSGGQVADEGERGITVPVVTLDEYTAEHGVDRIDVLKVDVEGYEPFVFEGARSLLEQRRVGRIVCEMNDEHLEQAGWSRERLCDLLAGYGYMPETIPPVGVYALKERLRGPAPRPMDVAFAPRPS